MVDPFVLKYLRTLSRSRTSYEDKRNGNVLTGESLLSGGFEFRRLRKVSLFNRLRL